MKKDIIDTFKNFHSHNIFEKSFNATYITLIPKKNGAKKLRDFRPISLIRSVYKLLSKVSTESLKKVVDKLVDAQQMAFIKNRQIMDAILIANELVDSRITQGKAGILCKLDIEKAYGHVNWKFLLKMFACMGVGRRWIQWINNCISTVRFSVLYKWCTRRFFPCLEGTLKGV